ncbi:MAG TPA: ethanolamine ammonia-lyase reactivating factor EutA [Trebonia sp.]|nr:ethanolamine ammonia-lyase reactivating factor EutA [Trebonia sp.]
MGHDHDHDQRGGHEAPPREELDFSIDGESRVLLTTAGVDIGSTTTQLTLCRIELRKVGSRFVVTSRDVFFQSEVLMTPVRGTDLDEPALAAFFAAQYEQAGIEVADIDSGVIILTGLALARQNSERVANIFAAAEGRFLAVAAGDATEATLGCRGAGIEALSLSAGCDIVHIDIGGGTTKLSLVVDGVIASTAAIDIGARLVTFDGDRRISGIEPPARKLFVPARRLPHGAVADETVMTGLTDRMAEQILAHAGLAPETVPHPWLLRTPPLDTSARRAAELKVTFAGGVSEYLYERETRTFGDLGRLLAASLRRQVAEHQVAVLPSDAGIRATVVGASEFTSQVSGNTIHLTNPGLLPLRGLPMARLPYPVAGEPIDTARLRDGVAAAVRGLSELIRDDLALVLSWTGSATFARLDDSAAAIVAGVQAARPEYPTALAVICDADVARVLGRRLEAHAPPGTKIVTIDGVDGADGDFLDIGPYVPGTRSVPVVVKTLLFPQESRSQ